MGKKLILSVLVFWIGLQSYSQTSETRYILLAWDTSLSMENRVPEHDFKFLDNYFERNPELRVNVVLFSNTVYANHEFEIMKGDWSAIKAVLENVDYDGATNLHSVESIISLEHTELFLFTDGAQTFGTGVPDFGIKTFVVNSNPYKEQNDLNAILVNNKVRLFDYGRPIFSQPEVKNTSTIKKSETQIQEVKDTLSPGPGISLSEVVVSEDLRVENPIETVDIGNGTVDKNRVGVAVQSIGENEISPIQTNVAQSVQGRFSGVRVGVKPNNDLSQVKMRSDNSMLLNNYGLIVIDGIPQRQSISETLKDNGTSLNPRGVKSANHPMASMGHIDPDNVADITVLKGLAATTRFGTLGANGVILITTKTSKSGKTSGKPVDRARLKNNIYDGDLMVEKKSSVPSYIKDLMAISNLEQAYEHYLKQRIDHLADPQFFLDVHDYFKPLDNAIAQRILSNLAELNAKNLSSLRVLAYKYELEGDFKQYLKINQQILDLDENSAQVKFDLALSAEDNKKYHLAYNQLTGLLHNNSDGLEFSGLKKPASNTLRNLLNTPNTGISTTENDKKYTNPVRYDARILVMWSRSNAQFELQIINPDKRFFTWEHSEFSDSKRYSDDIKNDTNTEEFQLIGAEKGDWFIKVNNLSEYEMVDPIFLKCIVYYNFGTPGQRKEVQLLKLSEDEKNPSFFKITL